MCCSKVRFAPRRTSTREVTGSQSSDVRNRHTCCRDHPAASSCSRAINECCRSARSSASLRSMPSSSAPGVTATATAAFCVRSSPELETIARKSAVGVRR
jgi:hypothetical protein